jgi:hypothetical protein
MPHEFSRPVAAQTVGGGVPGAGTCLPVEHEATGVGALELADEPRQILTSAPLAIRNLLHGVGELAAFHWSIAVMLPPSRE